MRRIFPFCMGNCLTFQGGFLIRRNIHICTGGNIKIEMIEFIQNIAFSAEIH